MFLLIRVAPDLFDESAKHRPRQAVVVAELLVGLMLSAIALDEVDPFLPAPAIALTPRTALANALVDVPRSER